MRILKALLSFAIMTAFGLPAHAKSCEDMRAAKATIEKAQTKQAVADGLVAAGARASDAKNLAAASPDVDVARATALRAVTPRTEAACKK